MSLEPAAHRPQTDRETQSTHSSCSLAAARHSDIPAILAILLEVSGVVNVPANMAVSIRGRPIRSLRMRGRNDSGEENVPLDLTRDPSDNLREILQNVVKPHGVSNMRKLGHLNNFIKVSSMQNMPPPAMPPTHVKNRLLILGINSQNFERQNRESTPTTTNSCRAISSEEQRSIGSVGSEEQRSSASVGSEEQRSSASVGSEEQRSSASVSLRLALLNEAKEVRAAGLRALRYLIRDTTILQKVLGLRVDYLIARCIDIQQSNEVERTQALRLVRKMITVNASLFPSSITNSLIAVGNDGLQERDRMVRACIAIICELALQNPEVVALRGGLSTILKNVIDCQLSRINEALITTILHLLNHPKTRQYVRSDVELEQILAPYTDFHYRHNPDTAEGQLKPDLMDNYLALVLSAFISSGLLEGLVEVITSSDDHVSVRATILLGELLHMANTILPHSHSHHLHCLPTLMNMAASFDISQEKRMRASAAVNYLKLFHEKKKQGPKPHSLYLDHIVHKSVAAHYKRDQHLRVQKDVFVLKDTEEALMMILRDSHILNHKQNLDWNWVLIGTILKWPNVNLRNNKDEHMHKFVRRLLYFYKPSSKLYANLELDHSKAKQLTVVGCQFIEFLLESDEDGQAYLEDLVKDIVQWLTSSSGMKPDRSLQNNGLLNTLSQHYFLFLGTLSSHPHGVRMLEKCSVFQCLLNFCSLKNQDHLLKLTVSTLDYSRDGLSRVILSKILTAAADNCRLYATKHLRVLLRANVEFFSNWGMELLVTQLHDKNKTISMESLDILDEACEDKANLHALIQMKPALSHLGDKGVLLLLRFLSIPKGFSYLNERGYVTKQLEKWQKEYNLKYVDLIEEQLNEALTTYRKPVDGDNYVRRSNQRLQRPNVYLPIHLYGQLVHDKTGCCLLEAQSVVPDLSYTVRSPMLDKWEGVKQLKAALWALDISSLVDFRHRSLAHAYFEAGCAVETSGDSMRNPVLVLRQQISITELMNSRSDPTHLLDNTEDTGLQEHTDENCLYCVGVQVLGCQTNNQINSTLIHTGGKSIPEDAHASRVLLRKEVLRLVVNLSSSVGTKGHETGLLTIKEKFPYAFDDICLYSEVSHLLAHCMFRLLSRRFIQELFQDVQFTPDFKRTITLELTQNIFSLWQMYEEAETILATPPKQVAVDAHI
ncbi:Rapamycin-insensitive companion of mTOR [Acipenser ruthenus]|uniref:Rapamycin-insensitive companion of mTOR n=1 Tax=Acipenser ruthenus TaxID=7906 RepID=A0A444U2S1_ACIRT|nr:Rapamycin-insensitive companion of mTOR [Acipenser ruthenus]